jgi:hypothetical protein
MFIYKNIIYMSVFIKILNDDLVVGNTSPATGRRPRHSRRPICQPRHSRQRQASRPMRPKCTLIEQKYYDAQRNQGLVDQNLVDGHGWLWLFVL